MDHQILLAAVIAPLVALGAFQLFGVRRLFGLDSLKIFALGVGIAFIAMPFLSMAGLADVAPGPAAFFEHGGRLTRIWSIVFALALTARIAAAIARWAWEKRPRRVVSERA